MSKVKKILALVLSMAMVLGMSMTTFAAGNADGKIGTADDRGKITVSGLTAEDSLVVTAYPIAMADYDKKNGNFLGYTNPYGIADIEHPTQAELSYIATQVTGGTELDTITDNGTTYSKDDMPVGMYLISVTGAETMIYNVAVASIQYKNLNGENIVEAGDVDVVDDAETWVKVTGTPDVSKTETIGTEDPTNGASANIGDTVKYEVAVNPIPNYGGQFPVLNVVDTLSKGLTYTANSLTVKIGNTTLENGKDYVFGDPIVNEDGTTTITVDFVVDLGYTLNDYAGQSAIISYNAVVNENAELNHIGNNNDVVLNFTNDSKTEGNDGTKEDKTYTYTFDIDGSATGTTGIITKKGVETDKDALAGAVFGLYTDADATELYTNTNFAGTATSDADGQLHMTGLAAGTYYLKELTAPEGYSVNTHIFKVEIAATYYDDGKLKSWSVTIDGTETAEFTVDNEGTVTPDIEGTDILNTKLSDLPSTGGIGTTIFTIGGCIIMIGAAFLFFRSRKKDQQ